MKDIVQVGDQVLRDVAQPVDLDKIDSDEIRGVIADMKSALATQEDGVAIAAPQIGIPLRIFVVSGRVWADDPKDPDTSLGDKVFVNPIITKQSKKSAAMDEGCLSVRWKYGEVKRSLTTTVRAHDEKGRLFTYTGNGLLSQIFQHETDHLDGVLFTDKAKNIQEFENEEHFRSRVRRREND